MSTAQTIAVPQSDTLPALLRATVSASSSSSSTHASLPDDLEDPSSSGHAQLLALTSQSLDELRAQPAALASSKTSLEAQLSTLCSRHVQSFVHVHSATAALPDAVSKLDEQLDRLLQYGLPALSNAAKSFPQRVEEPLKAKDRARTLLDQYEVSLKDLLDIPRLLMTCARANHPIEALQLGTYIAKASRGVRDGNDGDQKERRSVLLKALKEECWGHLARLREDLLRGLGSRGVRLPAARRYLSLLSRLRDVDEAGGVEGSAEGKNTGKLAISSSAICLSFLRSRWMLVEELGAHETDDDAHTQLTSQISAWRDVVGDTCTIALALFASQIEQTERDEVSPLSLISSFGYRALAKLEQLVVRQLPQVDASKGSLQDAFETLDSLHTQLSYAASSLSRQGLDFSDVSRARQAFEAQAVTLWARGIQSAVAAFEGKLATASKLSVSDLAGSNDARQLLSLPLEAFQSSIDWSEQSARFPPLAVLANQLLDAHEALLAFAPFSIVKDVMSTFDKSLADVVEQTLESFRKAQSDTSSTSRDVRLHPLRSNSHSLADTDPSRLHQATLAVTARFVSVLSVVLLPFIRTLLASTFQSEQEALPALNDVNVTAQKWAKAADEEWIAAEEQRAADAEVLEKQRLAAEEEEKIAAEKRKRDEAVRLEKEKEERRQAEEERRRQAAQAEEIRRQEEDTRRKKAEAAAERQRIAADEQRKKEEAERRRKEEEERQRKEEEEAERRRKEKHDEEIARKEKEEQERRREEERQQRQREEQKAREEAERKQKEQEEKVAAEQMQVEEQRKEEIAAERIRKEQEEEAAAAEAAAALAEQSLAEESKQSEQKPDEADPDDAIGQGEYEEQHATQIVSASSVGRVETESSTEETGPKSTQVDNESSTLPHNASQPDSSVNAQSEHADDAETILSTAQTVPPTTQEQAASIPSTNDGGHATDHPASSSDTADAPAQSVVRANEASSSASSARTPTNRLAEKLRKRQEERARAAAAAAAAAGEGPSGV